MIDDTGFIEKGTTSAGAVSSTSTPVERPTISRRGTPGRIEAAGKRSETARASRLLGRAPLDRERPADAVGAFDQVLVLTEPLGAPGR